MSLSISLYGMLPFATVMKPYLQPGNSQHLLGFLTREVMEPSLL
jgi:hypothetical protein